jgi:hypothetical protein
MQALLKYCLRTTVKASKKRLNFCEGGCALIVRREDFCWRSKLGLFPQKNLSKPNGLLHAAALAWMVEIF